MKKPEGLHAADARKTKAQLLEIVADLRTRLRAEIVARDAAEDRAAELEGEADEHDPDAYAREVATAEALADRVEHARLLAMDRRLGIDTRHHAAPVWSEYLDTLL